MKRDHFWRVKTALAGLAISGAFAFPGGAAQAQSMTNTANVNISSAVTIQKDDDLRFGDIIPGTTTSRFRVDPVTAAITQPAGDATHVGGSVSTAKFTISGTPLLRVRLTFGANRIFLTRVGGTEQLRVNRFRRDGPANRFLDAAGKATYAVGAQLRVFPTAVAGTYTGSFNVTVDYF